jgi:RNA polymerase sigma-70 factor (ECF subfamily)
MVAAAVHAQSDEWQRLLAGNKEAWDAFVLEHAGTILATVRKLSVERDDVEAIALEVFASLSRDSFQLLRSFDPVRASISTWLTIATLMILRRYEPSIDGGWPAVDLSPRGCSPPPLSTRQNLILMMLLQQGMTKGEIAAALNISVDAVRSAISGALDKVRFR